MWAAIAGASTDACLVSALKCAVIHINDAAPRNPPRIDVQLVLLMHVVVDERRQQVVRSANGMEVARKVQVGDVPP